MAVLENLISKCKLCFSLSWSVVTDHDLSLSPGTPKVMLSFGVISLYGWQEMSHQNFGAVTSSQ